jgi:hypothetical protein
MSNWTTWNNFWKRPKTAQVKFSVWKEKAASAKADWWENCLNEPQSKAYGLLRGFARVPHKIFLTTPGDKFFAHYFIWAMSG